MTHGQGMNLWEQVQDRLENLGFLSSQEQNGVAEPETRYGAPTVVMPRLGQGSFRVMVTDAYQRRCAITQEKILLALETAQMNGDRTKLTI